MTELALFCLAIGAVCLAGVCTDSWLMRRMVRRAVFENLDSAYGNGYFAPGELLHGEPPEVLAMDMLAFADDPRITDTSTPTLTRYCRQWLFVKGLL